VEQETQVILERQVLEDLEILDIVEAAAEEELPLVITVGLEVTQALVVVVEAQEITKGTQVEADREEILEVPTLELQEILETLEQLLPL
jgi:hypothetical protein